MMGRTVCADEPAPVQNKPDRKVLPADIMRNMVEGTLQKSRINNDERFDPLSGHTTGKSHSMPFGDPHIEDSVWVGFLNFRQTGVC